MTSFNRVYQLVSLSISMTKKSIAILVFFVLCCLLFIGFGIPATIDKAHVDMRKRGNCEVLKKDIGKYTCCFTEGCKCRECSSGAQSCAYMTKHEIEGECCDGYACCVHTCSTCCNNYGKTTSCHQCNCRCAAWVNNQQCRSKCYDCYRPKIVGKIISLEKENDFSISKECKRDYECAKNYLNSVPEISHPPNTTIAQTCWYSETGKKDGIYTDVVFNNAPTLWLWVVAVVFGGVSVMAGICLCIFKCRKAA